MAVRVICVIGTRPEAIKMAPVIRELQARPESTVVTVVTAQHRQMLDQALEMFALRPDHDLDVMQDDQTLTQVSISILERMGVVLQAEKPDLLLVQGDTATAAQRRESSTL